MPKVSKEKSFKKYAYNYLPSTSTARPSTTGAKWLDNWITSTPAPVQKYWRNLISKYEDDQSLLKIEANEDNHIFDEDTKNSVSSAPSRGSQVTNVLPKPVTVKWRFVSPLLSRIHIFNTNPVYPQTLNKQPPISKRWYAEAISPIETLM